MAFGYLIAVLVIVVQKYGKADSQGNLDTRVSAYALG